jgi:hypothetical protein
VDRLFFFCVNDRLWQIVVDARDNRKSSAAPSMTHDVAESGCGYWPINRE